MSRTACNCTARTHHALEERRMSKTILSNLTQDKLKEILAYNHDSGLFRWKVRAATNIKIGDVAGCDDSDGYRHIGIKGTLYLAQRLVWLYVYGKWPRGVIDHIDHDPSNNRIANLRDVTESENHQNRQGVRGYSWHRGAGKWSAKIKVNRKTRYIGIYETEPEARAAYLAAKKIFHPTTPVLEA